MFCSLMHSEQYLYRRHPLSICRVSEWMNKLMNRLSRWMDEWVVGSNFCNFSTNFRPPCEWDFLDSPTQLENAIYLYTDNFGFMTDLSVWNISVGDVLCTCLEALRKDMLFKYRINRNYIQSVHYLLKIQVWGNILVKTNNLQTIFLIDSST